MSIQNHTVEESDNVESTPISTGTASRSSTSSSTAMQPDDNAGQHENNKETTVPVQDVHVPVDPQALPVNNNVDNNNDSEKKQKEKEKKKAPSSTILTILRSLLFDLPLALLFLSFLFIYGVRQVHNDYYVPLMDRALRTDTDLHDEITYYERSCTEYDLSTRNIQDLVVNQTAPDVAITAVDQMMQHGALVLSELMTVETVSRLRAYIVRRNAAVTDAEAYPVSQGDGGTRLSYGIDATEDDAVALAIQQIASNPVLRKILQGLLGDDDPASAEITAITAYAGCPDQNWHQDTKADGNAIMYARTYSHSYSLFLPLQDTTAAMGATDICPGTHYCANDLENMCESTAMRLNEATPEQVFRAGDGALLNQHMWHRGTAHTDYKSQERIVFIMSFLARPSFGKDPRQLSRGTYFHQKWNMWGHTWKDLLDPLKSMRKPFSILRCLSLWKPAGYNWGYDLVTSGFMRFVNGQLENDDLEARFLPRLDQMHFPLWLRGRYLEDVDQSTSWRTFIQETIDNTYAFVEQVTIWAHGGYLLLVLITSLWSAWRCKTGTRVLRGTTFRLLLTHGLLLGLAFKTLEGIRTSDWGLNVLKGRTLMRPFPAVTIAREEAVMTSTGPTTLPQRSDVLIGTRYDADFLGSYDRWLDYHPGNAVFRGLVSQVMTPLHSSSSKQVLKTDFGRRLVRGIVDAIADTDGRFLLQDYRTGDWRILSDEEALEIARTEMVATSSGKMAAIRTSIDHLIADYRFGELRGTRLARLSQVRLWQLKKLLLGSSSAKDATPVKHVGSLTPLSMALRPRRGVPISLKVRQSTLAPAARIPAHERFSLPKIVVKDFQVGSAVECTFEGEEGTWYPGIIINADEDLELYSVSFHDDTLEHNFPRELMRKYQPIQQGDTVAACYQHDDECYTGTAIRVMPNADIQIYYDDGVFDYRVPAFYYSVQR
jgi:hypothetical protein